MADDDCFLLLSLVPYLYSHASPVTRGNKKGKEGMNKHIHGILSFFFSEKKIILNFQSKYMFKNNNISISVLDGMF